MSEGLSQKVHSESGAWNKAVPIAQSYNFQDLVGRRIVVPYRSPNFE